MTPRALIAALAALGAASCGGAFATPPGFGGRPGGAPGVIDAGAGVLPGTPQCQLQGGTCTNGGECCGAVCCGFGELCCNTSGVLFCLTPTVAQPNCNGP